MDKGNLDLLIRVVALLFLCYVHSDKTKNIFNIIYKYTPLLMAMLIPICGVLLFGLAPLAFTEKYHASNDIYEAYGVFMTFTVFAVGCFPLSKFMYTEYKDMKRRLPF